MTILDPPESQAILREVLVAEGMPNRGQVTQILEFVDSLPSCAGLAANQMNVRNRFFVMGKYGAREFVYDPQIVQMGRRMVADIEGCLSCPGINRRRSRPAKCKAEYTNQHGERVTKQFSGFDARVFLHELDHLDGILIADS